MSNIRYMKKYRIAPFIDSEDTWLLEVRRLFIFWEYLDSGSRETMQKRCDILNNYNTETFPDA